MLLVTRPAAQAAAWVEALRRQGCKAKALPLIDIGPAPEPDAVVSAWQVLRRFDLVMFVSANAVAGFFAHRPAHTAWPDTTLAASTGPGTSAALKDAGLHDAQIVQPAPDSAQFDSESLWQQLQPRCQPWQGRQALVVRGGTGRDWLADTLREAGAQVQFVVAYQRAAPKPDPAAQAALDAALAQPQQHVWLFSSSQAVDHLVDWAPQANWLHSQAWVTHPRIRQAARAAGFGVVVQIHPCVAAAVQQMGLSPRAGANSGPYNPQPCE